MAYGIGAASAPASPLGAMLAGGSPAGNPDGALQALMGKLRQIGQMVTQLQGENPNLADQAQRINQILKEMVVTAASEQSAQTASGLAVPGAGGGM